MWALYVWPLYGSTLCVATLCEHSMCGHSMWDHSMWALSVWPLYVTTLREHSMCEHSMCEPSMWPLYVWALYVWPLYVSTLCVTTLCVTTLCDHSMCEHSMWALYVGPFYVCTLCEHSMCGHSMRAPYVWPLYVSTLCVSTLCEHEHRKVRMLTQRKVRKLPRKMNISSWAGCGRTPKSTRITMQTRLQFLGRVLQGHKRQKSTSFIVKTPFKSIAEHRKVRELPRKMNIEEVEEPKKHENLQTKPVLGFSRAPQNAEKYENYHEKWTSKKLRSRKLRKFTDKSRSRRSPPPENYENSQTKRTCRHETTKIAMNSAHSPVRHLDLATPAFYYPGKRPQTVWK